MPARSSANKIRGARDLSVEPAGHRPPIQRTLLVAALLKSSFPPVDGVLGHERIMEELPTIHPRSRASRCFGTTALDTAGHFTALRPTVVQRRYSSLALPKNIELTCGKSHRGDGKAISVARRGIACIIGAVFLRRRVRPQKNSELNAESFTVRTCREIGRKAGFQLKGER
jgi:hypothetical protein